MFSFVTEPVLDMVIGEYTRTVAFPVLKVVRFRYSACQDASEIVLL